jgi:tellurite resistance-related uncharacterized protein
MKELPRNVIAYKKTPIFNVNNVPNGLLTKHNTKMGTFGVIVVVSGKLKYTIETNNENKNQEIIELNPNYNGIIYPQEYHKVELLSSDTTFYVEFYGENPNDVQAPKFIKNNTIITVNQLNIKKSIITILFVNSIFIITSMLNQKI